MAAAGLERGVWEDVVASLEEFLPYYERVNLASTLFQLPLWRSRAAVAAGPGDAVLELGPGSGGFARTLQARRVYLLEPSAAILRYARDRLEGPRYRPLLGLAEAIPLRTGTVDGIFCIFSFRDFLDKGGALREMARVLAPGGEVHIVDLFRPPPGLRRKLLDLWLSRGATALLRLLVPGPVRAAWTYDPYRELLRTYHAVGPAGHYVDLMREAGFVGVEATDLLLEGVHHLRGVTPSTT